MRLVMSEEVGKNVADLLLRNNPSITTEISHQEHYRRLTTWLKDECLSSVNALNKKLESHRLSIVERSDGFQFNFDNQLTLVVKVGPYLIGLEPTRSNTENPGSSKFTVISDDNGYQFKGIPAIPTFTTYPMTGTEFIAGVTKVACKMHFDAE
jgi:hypothetical protein